MELNSHYFTRRDTEMKKCSLLMLQALTILLLAAFPAGMMLYRTQ